MGNSQPTNRTGRKVTEQKLQNAMKLGVLSLSEHSLEEIPAQVFNPELAKKLRRLDLSKNKLSSLGRIGILVELKTLNLDSNALPAGSLAPVSKLTKLQTLSVSKNQLGKPAPRAGKQPSGPSEGAFPDLPVSLKQLNLASNCFSSIPRPIVSVKLINLEKLDLSYNQLATVPAEISNLTNLQELNLDNNMIVALPEEVGRLANLKSLSLRDNQFQVTSTLFNDTTNPQPLPKSLFTSTLLIDLNLHGNRMTNTQLNQFEGFQDFLDRRQKVKSKTMSNLDVCGLK